MSRRCSKQDEVTVGIDAWSSAPDSFLECPRCRAKASVRHVEPDSGGGRWQHLHRCTRCRHEWTKEPATWMLCPAPNCDAHGLDATGMAGRLEHVDAILSGQCPQLSLERQAQLLCADLALPAPRPDEARSAITVIQALHISLGGDLGTVAAWLHNRNTALGAAPATVAANINGWASLTSYLRSRGIWVVDQEGFAAAFPPKQPASDAQM